MSRTWSVRRRSGSSPGLIERLEPRQLLASQSPYSGSPVSLPGTVQAENFDWGGEGVAEHDTTSANLGGATFRGTTNVDLQSSTDTGGTYQLGYVQAGEWLEYTVKVQQSGTY